MSKMLTWLAVTNQNMVNILDIKLLHTIIMICMVLQRTQA